MQIQAATPDPLTSTVRVVVRIDREWRAILVMLLRHGRMDLAQLTVVPNDDTDPRDLIEDGWSFNADAIPPGGLPVRRVRQVDVDKVERHVRLRLAPFVKKAEERGEHSVLGQMLEAGGGVRPELSRPEQIAMAAGLYDQALREGRNTSKAIADALGVSRTKASRLVFEARQGSKPLLKQAPTQGKPGGGLTAHGRRRFDKVKNKLDAQGEQ